MMAVQIQLRRDTAANWTSANPTLAAGEMGFETDTLRYKLGDGLTAWADLQYGVFDGFTSGRRYVFDDTTTDGDPGEGKVRFDNATFGSITELYFDNTDYPGGDATAWLDALDSSSDPANKGTLFLQKHEEPGTYREFIVSGSVTDGTGYRKVPVTPLTSNGDLADGDQIVVAFYRTGAAGAIETTGTKTDLVDADTIIIKDSEDGDAVKDISVDNFLGAAFAALSIDEDDFASDSATKLPTQQSVKAYADDLPRVRYDASQSLSASQQAQARANVSAPLRGHIHGLTLSNNATDATNDIDIAAGEAASDGSDPVLMVLASALTKRLDAAWAVGTGNGGLDTGSIADGTYHVWLIQRSDTGVVDALFSTSATSPTMPTNYDRKRRIGSIIRSGGAILGFRQSGDRFELASKVTDRSGTAALADTLFAITVPSGVRVRPILEIVATYNTNTAGSTTIGSGDSSAANLLVSQYSGAVAFTTAAQIAGSVLTNLSAQIRLAVVIDSGSMLGHTIKTLGWIDTRGRLA